MAASLDPDPVNPVGLCRLADPARRSGPCHYWVKSAKHHLSIRH